MVAVPLATAVTLPPLTLATLVLLLLQVTLAPLGLGVALRVLLCPITREMLSLDRLTLGFLTVISQLA